MIGKRLSNFHILEKIGEGGMGVVYRARDEKLDREVALKVLQPDAIGNEERRVRFLREARAAAAVTHPNIATIHQIDEADGVIFIAMELVQGRPLSRLIADDELPLRDAMRLGIQLAEAISVAHAKGIVHRDLKPDNVLVTPQRHAKVLDFGLAKIAEDLAKPSASEAGRMETVSAAMTREGRVMGTAAYMSPEQARGLAVDPRTDIFSLGAVLYEMFAGKSAFQAATITDTLSAVVRDTPRPPSEHNPAVPLELEQVVAKCLQKDAKDRYQHADEIVVDLRRLRRETDSQPGLMASMTGEHRVTRRPIWRRVGSIAAVGIVAVVAVWGILEVVGPGEAGVNSLAVLPLQNLKDADDPERLGRILQELIITDLSGLGAIKVFSSQRIRDVGKELGAGKDGIDVEEAATEVARRVGATTMLTGTLSRLGERWMMACQLVNVRDGSVLKSERIDGTDLYAMADTLTGRIRGDLGVVGAAASGVETAVREKTTDSLDAMRHYIDGVELLNDSEFFKAVEELAKAVEIDPGFGEARFRLAIASWWAAGGEAQALWRGPSARQILAELLEGDFKLSTKERGLAEALLPLVTYDYEKAEPPFRELTESYPDEKDAWYGLGEALYHSPEGWRSLDAVRAFERAIELDPTFHLAYSHVRQVYRVRGMYGEALSAVDALIRRLPDDVSWQAERMEWLILQGDDDAVDRAVDDSLAKAPDGGAKRELLVRLARTYSGRERFDRARRYLDDALAVEADGGEVAARLAAADYHRVRHEYDRAAREAERALTLEPNNRQALQLLFSIDSSLRDFDRAIARARDLVSREPKNLQHYRYWVDAAAHQGDDAEVERALAAADAVASTAGERSWLWSQTATLYRNLGDAARSVEYMDRSLEVDPLEASMEDIQRQFDLGLATFMLRDFDRASDAFEGVLAKNDRDVRGLIGMALVALDSGDHETAVDYARRTVDVNRELAFTHGFLVQSLAMAGRPDEARRALEQGLEAMRSPADRRLILGGAAGSYVELRDFDRALELCERAVALDPEGIDISAARVRVLTLMRMGRLEAAATAIAEILTRVPRDWETLSARAMLEMVRGAPDIAERQVDELLETSAGQARLVDQMATILVAQGRFRDAEPLAREVSERAPLRSALSHLAWILVAGGLDLEEGARLAERAMEVPYIVGERALMFPQSPSAEHALGLVRLEQGRYDDAVRLLEQAADLQPGRASIREHLERARARR